MSLVALTLLWVVFLTVAVSLAAQVGLYISAAIELHRVRRRDRYQLWRRMLTSPLAPRISVLVPAYNESASIVESVTNLLSLTYPNLEVIAVSDGSTDDTLERLTTAFKMSPVLPVFRRLIPTAEVKQLFRSPDDARLVVVHKQNGGKADALNAAVNIASGELVCAIDADTVVAHNALQQLVSPFLASNETVAVGGTVRLVNNAVWRGSQVTSMRAPTRFLVGAQTAEYPRAFLVGRLAWNPLGGNLIISGAFGLFRKSALVEVGGYEHGSIGEDMELVVRLRRTASERGGRAGVKFSPNPVAYTEAPESLRTLARQRNRWFRGLLDVLVRHRRMILNPKYGSAGLIAMPYFVVVEALSPLVEAFGLIFVAVALASGWIRLGALAPIAVLYLIGICASYAVILTDDLVFKTYHRTRDRVRLAAYVLFEQIIFRPLTLVWRLWGLWLFLLGRSEWGAHDRRGLST